MYLPIVYSSKSVNWWGIANKISNKITWARRAKARFTFKERIHLKIKKKMKVLNRSNHLHLVMRILLPEWVMKRDIGFSKLSIKISLKISFSIENPKKVSVSLRIQLQIYSHRIWGKKYRNNLTILHMKMRKNSMILYLKMKSSSLGQHIKKFILYRQKASKGKEMTNNRLNRKSRRLRNIHTRNIRL